MKKFKFNLEGYLKIKDIQEKKKLYDFAKVNKVLNEHRLAIEEYDTTVKVMLQEDIDNFRNGSFNYFNQKDKKHYLFSLQKKVEITKNKAESIKHELETKKNLLIQARKEKKIIEVFKEKKYEQHLKKENAEELIQIDSIETGKYASRKREQSSIKYKKDTGF